MLKMRLKILYILLLVATVCGLCAAGNAPADTVYVKDGKELKGIVVEDFKDRIIFSTADGEITVMKSDIKALL
jgi:hypothetical protein